MSGTEAKFHVTERSALRAVPWWDRVGYIQRRLPAAIAECLRSLALPEHAQVLDYGCADRPYRGLLPATARYVGADLPGNPDAEVQIRADGSLPLPDDSFDAVLSTQVLEHVAHPDRYLAECYRVLRPGGRLLLSTHGIMVYHPDPVDYWRWTGEGLRVQIERAGLCVLSITGVMGLAATGLQLFQDALYGRLPGRLRKPFTALMQMLIALFDRYESAHSRSLNALVFAIVAEKPRAQAAPDERC